LRPARDPGLAPDRIYATLLALHPPAASAPLCVAFSGGADSTALLGLLAAVPAVQGRLRALHIDHGLHPQSASWARACRACARVLKVPFATRRLALRRGRGQSLEALARAARYAALAQELRPAELLLTAHHLEDQLETVLLQLLRGAGLPGLAAMPAVTALGTGFLVRPLLGVARARLRAWLQQRGLPHLEDPSNRDAALDRNYLRHRVLPAVVSRWPGAARTLARTAGHIAQAQQLLDELAAADVARAADGAALAVTSLRALPLARRRNALRWWISQAGPAPCRAPDPGCGTQRGRCLRNRLGRAAPVPAHAAGGRRAAAAGGFATRSDRCRGAARAAAGADAARRRAAAATRRRSLPLPEEPAAE
jgi:tRNA(Ile)-lysidine synthase